MTKTYVASVTNKETKEIEVITNSGYTNKKDFAHDLRVNGYAVRFISTPEKFDEDCENYYWKSEERKHARIVAKQHKSQSTEQTEVEETEHETEFYFTNENGEWIGKQYSGYVADARVEAKKLANELGEEIAINTCKKIEYVGEKNAGEEFARVCDADGDVMAVCSTPGAANAWCAKNEITGEIGEFEPYIELGTFNDNGNFEVDDYSSIDEYSGRITLVNDYFQTVEIVYPEKKQLSSELLDSEECDSGFEYYSVKVAYEAMKDKNRSIVFMSYSEALEVAKRFMETWGGEKAIVIAVSFVIRNDRQPTSNRDKRVLEDETAEIERRCVPYNYLGLRGYVSIEDKQIVNEDIA